MPKVSPIQTSFAGGELSELLEGRVDIPRYASGLKTCKNYIPTPAGPLTRRPGTKYVANVKTDSKKTRLLPFIFSTEQAYMLEFGDLYMRAFKNNAVLGAPLELVTVFTEARLFDIDFAQSADILYLAQEDTYPQEVIRTGTDDTTDWAIQNTPFEDGPYLNVNATATTLTPSGTSGSITLTASAVTGINDDQGFLSTDVGRLVRFKDSANNWTWLEITARSSTTVVTATVKGNNLSTTTATAFWRLGAWSDTTGYPAAVTFYQDRLWYAGGGSDPQRIDASQPGDYTNFAPTEVDGSITDANALSITLLSNEINAIKWLLDDNKGLIVGTTGGEWAVQPINSGSAISITNVDAKRQTRYGSAKIEAVRAGDAILFIQKATNKVRELQYDFDSDKFKGADMSVLAAHLMAGGFAQADFQKAPHQLLWLARADGLLVALTYDREQEAVGWSQHQIGGASDASGTPAVVESVAVIPNTGDTAEELWLVVKRWINGAVERHIEYTTKFWEAGDDITDAFFVDSGVTYDSTATTTITGLGHLEGETVSVLADGAAHPDKTVASGQITLDRSASTVQVGLIYTSDFETLRYEAGAADGTAQGKTQRIHRVFLRLWQTLGMKCGASVNELNTLIFRDGGDPMDSPPPLFSGDFEAPYENDYSNNQRVYVRQDQPFPGTILALMPQMKTEDRG